MSTGERDRGGWTRTTLAYVERVNSVLEALTEYWPLTLRQVYYQLVACGAIDNEPAEYKKLSRLVAKARLDDLISWDALEDRARSTLRSKGWTDKDRFIRDELRGFLRGYRRDLPQSQRVALEVWLEKDALSRIVHRVAVEYCVPVIVGRGFSSVTFVHECRKRVEQAVQAGKDGLRILYFGDLDPSGYEMLPTMLETLQWEMQLGDRVSGHQYALTPAQARAHNLPRNPDALKATDSRAAKFMARFGRDAYELDALPAATLEALVRQAIEQNLELSQYLVEQQVEASEREEVETLRAEIAEFLSYPERASINLESVESAAAAIRRTASSEFVAALGRELARL